MHTGVEPEQFPEVADYAARQVLDRTERANRVARQLVEDIAAELRPGVTEQAVREAAIGIFKASGAVKKWHVPYIYFGPHTLLTAYDRKAEENRVLGENDIAYIDIGPVIEVDGAEIEGDVGRSYVFGNDPRHAAARQAAERLFQEGVAYWKQARPTGIELYRYIRQRATEAGFLFNLNPAGHLIGSFPHKGWRDGLERYPFVPDPGVWILEIQLRHPDLPFGAFYEDILQ